MLANSIEKSSPSPFRCSIGAAENTHIVIQIKNGVAILTGQACSVEERDHAESIVGQVCGVDKVYNLLKLERSA